MNIFLSVIFGLAVAAFFKDIILIPYFNRLERKQEDLTEVRIIKTKRLPQMTVGKASRLLGIRNRQIKRKQP